MRSPDWLLIWFLEPNGFLYFLPLPLKHLRVCLPKQIRVYLIKLKRAIWWLILTSNSYQIVSFIDQFLPAYRGTAEENLSKKLVLCFHSWSYVWKINRLSICLPSWLQGELQHNRQHWRNRLQRHLLHLGREWRGQGTKQKWPSSSFLVFFPYRI